MQTKIRISAIYAAVMGVCMFGTWAMFMVTGSIPELKTTPVAISLHLAAEFAAALMLIIGAYGLLSRRWWGQPVHLISLGMLIYTVIQSAGYFAQLGQYAFTGMFAVFFVLTLMAIWINLSHQP